VLWEIQDDNTDICGVWLRWIDNKIVLEYECECCGKKKCFIIDKITAGYSITEKTVFYYIKQGFPDAIQHYHNYNWLGYKELDIFIPSLNCGIEVDSSQYHKDSWRDKVKDNICKNYGVKLIRLRDKKCQDLNDSCIEIKYSNGTLEKAIRQCLECLGFTGEIDVGIKRDKPEIEKLIALELLEKVKKEREDLYHHIYVCSECLEEFGVDSGSKVFQIV